MTMEAHLALDGDCYLPARAGFEQHVAWLRGPAATMDFAAFEEGLNARGEDLSAGCARGGSTSAPVPRRGSTPERRAWRAWRFARTRGISRPASAAFHCGDLAIRLPVDRQAFLSTSS